MAAHKVAQASRELVMIFGIGVHGLGTIYGERLREASDLHREVAMVEVSTVDVVD